MTDVLPILAAYLLGSFSGSLLLGRLRGVDIRTLGSGNAGGTNALRTQGWKFALGTVLVDVGKGVLAVWLALRFGGGEAWLPYATAAAAILGHVYPVFHGFRGGKGAGTLVGALLLAWPVSVAVLIGMWLLVLTGAIFRACAPAPRAASSACGSGRACSGAGRERSRAAGAAVRGAGFRRRTRGFAGHHPQRGMEAHRGAAPGGRGN